MQVQSRLKDYRGIIERELEQALHSSIESAVVSAMRYSALGGGKRIRGALCLEFCRVFGGDVDKAGCVAAAIEMIQAFSLIHDDLPCMDDDDFRRGKPSCHKKFGEATALLAGDALSALAFNTAAAAMFLPKGVKPHNAVAIVSALSNATAEMIYGQQTDMEFEKIDSSEFKKSPKNKAKQSGEITEETPSDFSDISPEIPLDGSGSGLSEESLIAMYNRKTCALISAACVCGAICADAGDKNIHKARSYGVSLGLAFQLRDDILDFETEKPGKKTFATLFGKARTREKAAEYTDIAAKIAKSISGGDFLRELALELGQRKA